MLKIDVIHDEDLQDAVNNFISALLPHEFYEPSLFTEILNAIFKYVRLEEFQLEYRLLLEALYNLNKLKVSLVNYVPMLTRDIFYSLLETSIDDAIVRPGLGVTEWLKFEGLDSNLSIQMAKENACQKLCERALELYDKCHDLGIASESVMNYEPELREAFIANVCKSSINTQADITRHDVKVGRKRYRGYSDWRVFTTNMIADLNRRLDDAESEHRTVINCIENSDKLLGSLSEFFVPIAKYGIPQLDDYTPILRHRLVVVVGKENIGKTKFAVDQAVNVILEGGKVVYMCGETQQAKVYADILINYIWKKYSIIVRAEHLVAPSECPEDVRKAIGMSIDFVVSEGALILSDAFDYSTVFQQMQSIYEDTQFDMVVIDHSCALIGNVGDGSLKAKVDALSDAVRDFRKKYPVCVMVTSHPSTTAKESDSRGKVTSDSATKGSQNLSTDADEVLYLRDNETLRKQGLIMLENTKRRDAGRVNEYVILRKNFAVSAFIYDENEQAITDDKCLERSASLELLNSVYSGDEDDNLYNL